MSHVRLSIVVPAYNEETRILSALKRICAYGPLSGGTWELIIVNDGSKDRTRWVIEDFQKAHPDLPVRAVHSQSNHGKGYACREGVLAAEGDYVLLTDTDLSAPIKESSKLTAALEKGADVAVGSRALRSPGADVRQSVKRRLAGRIFNLIVQALILPGIYDTQCGFKAFTRKAGRELFSKQKLDGFSFDVEVLYLARRAGYKIAEVPIMWSEVAGSKVDMLRDSTRMVGDLLKIRRLHS